MNVPNKLTVFRVVLTPIYMAEMLLSHPYHYLIAAVVFIVASITDAIDGKMARKNNDVTTFGKFLDPLADKILTTAAFLCLMQMGYCSIWVVMIVLTREFAVTSIRLIAAADGTVIAANIWGKIKTSAQMIFTCVVLGILAIGEFASIDYNSLSTVSNIGMWIIAALTVISGFTYIKDNIGLINQTK